MFRVALHVTIKRIPGLLDPVLFPKLLRDVEVGRGGSTSAPPGLCSKLLLESLEQKAHYPAKPLTQISQKPIIRYFSGSRGSAARILRYLPAVESTEDVEFFRSADVNSQPLQQPHRAN